MAFNASNLVPVVRLCGDQQEPRVIDYSTADNISTVEGSGYFNGGLNKLRRTDLVRVTAGDGKGLYYVENINCPIGGSDINFVKLAVATSFPSL